MKFHNKYNQISFFFQQKEIFQIFNIVKFCYQKDLNEPDTRNLNFKNNTHIDIFLIVNKKILSRLSLSELYTT